MKILYLCDSKRKIADGKCNGKQCSLYDNCKHTSDIEYAINKDILMNKIGDIGIRFENVNGDLFELEEKALD